MIDGQCGSNWSGVSVSSAGDVNGDDGLADLIVRAYLSNPPVGGYAGRSYVIFGSTTCHSADEPLVVGVGNAPLVSGGGADVLYGGAGNDVFSIDGTMVTSLSSAMGAAENTTQLARVDGGTGIYTLRVSGAGITLNLTQIANQVDGGSRLETIDKIGITGTGANTQKLSVTDAWDLAGMNWLNSSTKIALEVTGGVYNFGIKEFYHQLVIDGSSGDTLQAAALEMLTDTAQPVAMMNSHAYEEYKAQLA